MTDSPEDEPSFDPKTWLKLNPDAGKAPEAGPPPSPAPRPPQPPAGPRKGPPILVLALGGVVLLGGAGAVAAFLILGHRPAPAHPAARPAPAATSEAAAAPADAATPADTSGAAEHRSLVIGGVKQLAGALTSAGVSAQEAGSAAAAAAGRLGAAPGVLHLEFIIQPTGGAVRLVSLEARRDDGSGVAVARDESDHFVAKAAASNVTSGVGVIRSELDANSFYTSAVAAGVPDVLISPFAQAFTFDFDFQREVKPGDIFEAAFSREVDSHGDIVGTPVLLYVSLQTAAKSRSLYRFKPANGQEGWFDGNGRSIVRSLMRTPVEGARISSGFGMRMHPVQGFEKMHNGTDFAAPVGTPIYAAGDGVVQFSGPKGPNGNFVLILHDNGWQTLYLHQNRIMPDIVVGARVHQGQQIGEVGATGVDRNGHSTVTGPHLHYEVHIDGKPVDPMSIVVDAGQVLSGDTLKAFIKERNRIDALRQQQSG